MIGSILNNILGKSRFQLKKYLKKETYRVDLEVQNIVEEIKENSFSIIPDFFTREECDNLKYEIDILIAKRKEDESLWIDNTESDKRCFGAEDDSELIAKYFNDSFLLSVAENYFCAKMECSNTLASKINFKEGNIGSGQGCHRDG